MSKPLFENDSSDDETVLKTNKEYAKSYNKFRQKELLKKIKDKEARSSESSSESESSESEDEVFDVKFDEQFYKTLASLKQKDPSIYEKSTKFFEEDNADEDSADVAPKKKVKKLTIKQYEQDVLLQKGGVFDEDEENDESQRSQSPCYNEEQRMIKKEFKKALEDNSSDEDGNDFGGLFTKRQKSKRELEKEKKEQQEWAAECEELKAKSARVIWSSEKLSKDEKFLRDYILSNGYADKEDDEIPTYDEIVGDDDFEEKQTEFEHKYNFRFEDPDQDFIKRYPRTIDHSVRKVDTRRKEKRAERKVRKEQEKNEKFQEIELAKEIKRKEIEEKIAQLKAVTGEDDLNVADIDLEGDFDPDEYDKKMNDIFNSEYYQVDEGDEKPEAPSDIEDLQIENYDDYDGSQNEERGSGAHYEDEDFNMDCDYEGAAQDTKKSFQEEIIESTRSKRKHRKRKSKFMEMLERDRPVFNPDDEKTYGDYLDEYYKLDCEDVIGDVKCRFKYVETEPCDYGLTIEEILGAKNKELNAWASLKKATQIRPDHVERNEQMMFQRKARNEFLKKKILKSLYESSEDEAEEEKAENPTVIKSNKPLTVVDFPRPEESFKNEESGPSTKTHATQKTQSTQKNQKKVQLKSPVANTSEPSKSSERTEIKIEKRKLVETGKKEISQSKVLLVKPSSSKPLKIKKKIRNDGITIKMQAYTNFKAKQKNKLKKTLNKTINKRNKKNTIGFSDERLKAFGINPKKFNKKQKYDVQQPASSASRKVLTQVKHEERLKNKLKKALVR